MKGLRVVWSILAVSLVLGILSILPTVAGAQDGAAAAASPLGILNNPIVLMAVGLVVQFVPGVRKVIGNSIVPYLTTILAWLSTIMAPAASHAAGGPIASLVVASIPTFGLGGLLGGLGGSILQAAQGYLLQRMFAWPGKVLPALPADSRA